MLLYRANCESRLNNYNSWNLSKKQETYVNFVDASQVSDEKY